VSRVAHGTANGTQTNGVRSTQNEVAVALSLLVVCRGGGDAELLEPLRDDPRIELFVTEHLTPTWVTFAQRVAAGILLLGTDDPLGALVYARTAGIEGTILLAVDRAHGRDCVELEHGGATCVQLPLGQAALDRIVAVLSETHSAASVDPTLRLLFDPIGRVVRYRDKSTQLSQREFALLHCLAQHSGRPVRADQILGYVWENASPSRSRQIVDVYVCQLRRKLARIGLANTIKTLRGYGYTLERAV
jgi:DNA-binding response OmpR family regulator